MPNDEEQEEAWHYVCQRVLERPATNILIAIKYILVFLTANILFAVATYLLIAKYTVKPMFVMIVLFYILLSLAAFLKKAIIGLVKLYQRYAPERIRRKCIFKPTCSEYMILALEKYGLIKGLYKGMYRMFFRCKGFYYSVDYP
jgi:putative component of membrane protein insertase Oxa1/YidC/SpoIIIJ protein YidD